MQRKKIDVRRSLRVSLGDGVFASVMLGVTDNYVIPFALLLGATVQQVGLISGLPNLLGSLSQLGAARLVQRLGGRLRLLTRTVTIQAATLVMIAFLARLDMPYRVEGLLLLLALFSVAGALGRPAWGSLMTEYLPRQTRGSYFGRRNLLLGMVNVASMIGAGFLLYTSKEFSSVIGFFVIFMIAAVCRFVSGVYVAQMSDVAQKRDPASDFTFFMFLGRFRESNFVKFVAFVAALTFAAHLASPFFAVYMLRDLQFSYLTYTAVQVVSTGAGLVALPWWGRHADLVGNARVLRLSGFVVTLIPLLWLVSRNVVYLTLVQALAGFGWSGVTLCAGNFIYDAVTPQKRVRCIGYFNVITGSALFLGASAGGLLAASLPPLQGSPILTLFAISSLCRLAMYFALFRSFQEVRPSKEVSFSELFFSVTGVRPLIGLSGE
ncbi:MAG: MFS transporter [Deltaproteobacteria bacterium]|nr:MFS transporter [Deltaproteobacteria bacterium]